jgi:hypothetical protein
MTIEEVLMTKLLSETGLTALVGNRIQWDKAGQGWLYPYVVGIDISNVPEHTHQGQTDNPRPIKQFSIYADSRSSAKAVSIQIKSALSDFQGLASGTYIDHILLQNDLVSTYVREDGTVECIIHDLEYEIAYKEE